MTKRILAMAVLALCVAGIAVPAVASCRQIGWANGYLWGTGDSDWYRVTLQGGVRYRFDLQVPWPADFDIYIYRVWRDIFGNTRRTLVASGTLPGSANERVYYRVPFGNGGTYHIEVRSYRGSGHYRFTLHRC